MAIKKQDFYEGAALYMLVRGAKEVCIRYEAPFFRINAKWLVFLKYCAKSRSPWGFTFGTDEQLLIQSKADGDRTVIGFVCGSDGVAAIAFPSYLAIAAPRNWAVHVACFRKHGEHYLISGPDGRLVTKVAPSQWQRILNFEV